MRGILEHMLYLVFGHARGRELGQFVARKKPTSGVSKLGAPSPPHKKKSL